MKIATLSMDPQNKLRFEIIGKSSVRYHLQANHQVECKRWFWALNNAIQWSKDEAKDEVKRQKEEEESLQHAKDAFLSPSTPQDGQRDDARSSISTRPRNLIPATAIDAPQSSIQSGSIAASGEEMSSVYEHGTSGNDVAHPASKTSVPVIEGDVDDEEEYGDDASSHELRPVNRDAFAITAQSVRLQLDLLAQVSSSLQSERDRGSTISIQDPALVQALSTYDSAVGNLRGLVGDLFRISKDRDAYWQYRLERELNMRRMWEDSMAKFAQEHEELQIAVDESEDKRKKTKRALKDALENLEMAQSGPATPAANFGEKIEVLLPTATATAQEATLLIDPPRRKSTFVDLSGLSDSDEEGDDEFFDAVGSGEVEVVVGEPLPAYTPAADTSIMTVVEKKDSVSTEREREVAASFRGYEDPIRSRLRLDADNRPKISLWVSKSSPLSSLKDRRLENIRIRH